MNWRLVNSLAVFRSQVDAAAPGRSRASDGTIGDKPHQEESQSDHNPEVYPALGPVPVVTAEDITHDPAHGCDAGVITEELRLSRDPRIKYTIFNRRMFSSYPAHGFPAWTWRPYTGTTDVHLTHLHLSVQPTPAADSILPWQIGDDMSAKSDGIIASLAAGVRLAPDGTVVAPVDWEIRREALEAQLAGDVAAVKTMVAAQNATVTALAGLLQQGSPDVAPLVAQIQALTAQVAQLAAAEAAVRAQLQAAGKALT